MAEDGRRGAPGRGGGPGAERRAAGKCPLPPGSPEAGRLRGRGGALAPATTRRPATGAGVRALPEGPVPPRAASGRPGTVGAERLAPGVSLARVRGVVQVGAEPAACIWRSLRSQGHPDGAVPTWARCRTRGTPQDRAALRRRCGVRWVRHMGRRARGMPGAYPGGTPGARKQGPPGPQLNDPAPLRGTIEGNGGRHRPE